ncbi:MAG: carbohydrate-binding protein [Ruminococcaceae bacterium]|nr:carbohydrate-binding protein [Oscillospiraceae bacterium]
MKPKALRIVCLLMSLVCCFGVTSCFSGQESADTTADTQNSTTATAEELTTSQNESTAAVTEEATTELAEKTTTATGEETTITTEEDTTMQEEVTTKTEMAIGERRDVKLYVESAVETVDFSPLELGKVSAKSWLLNQARLMADNITKDFETLSPDCKAEGDDRSGWLGGTGESWERGTYYARGLVAMAYVLDDEELKAQAQKWIDWTLESQTESGMFGPYADDLDSFDYWAVMPMLMALTYYADATKDARVEPFLAKYFAWQAKTLPTRPMDSWGYYRAGDNIYVVLWLYDRTGDESLVELANLLFSQTYNWSGYYTEFTEEYWEHIVNLHQSFKLYPIMYSLTGDQKYLDYYYEGLENTMRVSGRADGMTNGDEKTRGILSTYGTETCAVAERMLSDEIALYLLRDASIADHLENITYNAWPQQLLPDGKGQVYFTMQNQIDATLGNRGFTSDGGDRSVYGVPGGYPCCAHNYHMGWPLFISSMWMSTSDGGLAVGAYGPNSVSATVGKGTAATLTQETNYPYEETVTITINADKTDTWPLYLRVPEWCGGEGAELYVNGHRVEGELVNGEYFRLVAEWKNGDAVTLIFPMEIKISYAENNSITVKYGGVLFALKLTEEWEAIGYNPLHWNLGDGYTSYGISVKRGMWQYAYSNFNFDDIASNFEITFKDISDTMQYKQSDAPIILSATFRRVSSWRTDTANTADVAPVSPLSADDCASSEVTLKLIPYAFTRLRMTMLPWVGEDAVEWTPDDKQPSGDGLLFTGVVGAFEGLYAHSAVAAHTPRLNIKYKTAEDVTLALYVNTTYCGKLDLEAGEETLTVFTPEFMLTYYNRIEFKTTDGSDISDKIVMSFTVTVNEGSIRYDAEAGVVNDAIKRPNHVGGIDNIGSSVTFGYVTFPEEGSYVLRIYYCALSDATHTLFVDGEAVGTINYRGVSSAWGTFSKDVYTDIEITVSAGAHTVKIEKTATDISVAELDYFEIIS